MKKVAIIGAGLAGLCCAHELERYGIKPVIYEKNSFIGEAYPHVTAILNITHRPIKDSLQYFKSLNIDIKPLNTLNSVVHNSPNKVTTIKGNLGYTFLYTKDNNSVKTQLYNKLKKSKIVLSEIGDYRELTKQYDYVVAATGDSRFAEELGIWQTWLQTYVRGAVVLGNFDVNSLTMWINKDYCKNGYAYMTVYSPKKASIVLVVPDADEKDIDHYWELFLYSEGLKYNIVEEFKLEHKTGFVYPLVVDNIIFAGNAAGGIDPFLGFGHYNAVTMGVAAAHTIARGKSYEKQLKDVMQRNKQMREFRKMYNGMTNKDYDKLLTAIGLPGVRHLLYNSNLNISQIGAFLSKVLYKRGGGY